MYKLGMEKETTCRMCQEEKEISFYVLCYGGDLAWTRFLEPLLG